MRIIMRVAASCLVLPAVLLGPLSSGAEAATQDVVTGSGIAGSGTFAVDAIGGPNGENSTGTVEFDLAIGTGFGTVSCMKVTGHLATVGGVLTGGTAFPAGFGFIFHVADNADAGLQDLIRLEILGSEPSFCPDANLISPAGVESGDIVVIDGVAPTLTISALISTVESYALDSGVETGLLVKLYAASEGQSPANCNQLTAFLGEVNALKGNKLTIQQADNLLADASAVRTSLGCN
jgi:hypothetical protein